MVFPKKLRWNLIFLALSGKTIFFFSENMILPLDGKWKMIFLKKNTRSEKKNSNLLKRWSFQKVSRRTWYFLYYLERWYFLPENMVFSPWSEIERGMTFLKKYTETWYFLFDMFHAPLRNKNQRRSYPTKIHLKVIDIPDRHPRNGSSNSLYLHRDFYRRFLEVWLLPQFIRLEIFYYE